jgi:hypothetical protein
MVANISVGHDENVNIPEDLQMFTTAWENLNVTTTSNCWHKAGTLTVRDKTVNKNFIDDDIKVNWQQTCQKINIMMEDFNDVDSDVAVIQETTDMIL